MKALVADTASSPRRVDERTHAATFEKLRVVTPIDPTSAEVRLRRDVLAEYPRQLGISFAPS